MSKRHFFGFSEYQVPIVKMFLNYKGTGTSKQILFFPQTETQIFHLANFEDGWNESVRGEFKIEAAPIIEQWPKL